MEEGCLVLSTPGYFRSVVRGADRTAGLLYGYFLSSFLLVAYADEIFPLHCLIFITMEQRHMSNSQLLMILFFFNPKLAKMDGFTSADRRGM